MHTMLRICSIHYRKRVIILAIERDKIQKKVVLELVRTTFFDYYDQLSASTGLSCSSFTTC